MSNLKIISEILDDKFLSKEQKQIIERNKMKDGSSFEMKFPIVNKKTIEYKLYKFESKDFPFFKEVAGLKKMCDYILFSEEGMHLYIFLIELKVSPESAKQQLDAANEFALFIINSSKRVGNKIDNYSIKKIRICQNRVNKRKNMAVENDYEFDSNEFLDYKLKSIHLEHLMRY